MDDGTAVGRTFAVLSAVGSRSRITLAEIVSLTGIPKPTAHRIAESLVARGALIRGELGYHVAPVVTSWASHAIDELSLRRMVAALDELRARCGGFAWFVQHSGSMSAQPELVSARSADRAEAATCWPDLTRVEALAHTAVGHALLAARPELAARVAHALQGRGGAAVFADALARGRDRGIHFVSGNGWRCTAATVLTPAHGSGIVGITVRGGRRTDRDLLAGTAEVLTTLRPGAKPAPGSLALSG